METQTRGGYVPSSHQFLTKRQRCRGVGRSLSPRGLDTMLRFISFSVSTGISNQDQTDLKYWAKVISDISTLFRRLSKYLNKVQFFKKIFNLNFLFLVFIFKIRV